MWLDMVCLLLETCSAPLIDLAGAWGFEAGQAIYNYRDLFLERPNPENFWKLSVVEGAPYQEVVLEGHEDLSLFTILQWHLKDGGTYISLPIVITDDFCLGVDANITAL